jgi:type IV pilus assembly protein PilC
MEFKYTARTREGQIQRGSIDAASKAGAVTALQNRNLIILDLIEGERTTILTQQISIFQRVKGKEMVAFSRQLSTLFSARIPLLEALRVLAKQTSNKYFGQVILEVANEIEGGSLLSKALAKYPKVFSQFFVNMIRSGEVSGGLDKTLNYLADYLEKQFYLNSKIRGAMAYPAFIFGAFILIGTLMMILVVPQLTSFLVETGAEMPLPTRMLIGSSDFIITWGWLVLILVIGAIVG